MQADTERMQADTELHLTKETLMHRPCFHTRRTSAWNCDAPPR